MTESVSTSEGVPRPLLAAVVVVALEAVVLLAYAVLELFSLTSGRVVMGLSTAGFFAVVGAGLAGCAWAALRRQTWARSPLVLSQLMALGLAWSFRGGQTTWVAVLLALAAVIGLVGVLHSRSMTWLLEGQSDDR